MKDVETIYGPYQYNWNLLNDNIPKIVMGPLEYDNGGVYYGQLYFYTEF